MSTTEQVITERAKRFNEALTTAVNRYGMTLLEDQRDVKGSILSFQSERDSVGWDRLIVAEDDGLDTYTLTLAKAENSRFAHVWSRHGIALNEISNWIHTHTFLGDCRWQMYSPPLLDMPTGDVHHLLTCELCGESMAFRLPADAYVAAILQAREACSAGIGSN